MKREKNRFLPLEKSNVPASGSGRLYSVLSPPFDNRAQLSQHRIGPPKPALTGRPGASTTSNLTSRAVSWGPVGTSTPTHSCSTTRSAAFEICRKRGFKVMAHANNPDAVKNAIRLGVHSIEHGYIMDDECIALLLEHGPGACRPSPSAILRPARPPTRSKPPGLPTAGSRMRYVAVPRQPRTCTPRGSAKRSIPVYEWHRALTSALSRRPRC